MRESVRVIPKEAPRVRSTRRKTPGDGVTKHSDLEAGHETPANGGIQRAEAASPSESEAGDATPASGGNPDRGAASPCGSEADRLTPTRRLARGRCAASAPPLHLVEVPRPRRPTPRMTEAAARIGGVRRLLVEECSLQIVLQSDSLHNQLINAAIMVSSKTDSFKTLSRFIDSVSGANNG
jgi:hypothetical protein